MLIPLEQLVYGSFPFSDRGYDILARSPGCRADWAADAVAACRRFGEGPTGFDPAPALFALRLASGPWAVVGVGPQGADDRGRPGALAFHVLIVQAGDYRRAGADPFAFAAAHRRDWSAGATLGPLAWAVAAPSIAGPSDDPRARRVAEALARGRRVALESPGPIDRLARDAWALLPESKRRRASVATWAFGNANRFDLVALPRLAGVALDRSYIDPASLDADPTAAPVARRPPLPRRIPTSALAVAALALVAGLAWRAIDGARDAARPADISPDPSRPALDAEARSKALADLADLADRFGIAPGSDPTDRMVGLSDRLRYRGPTLGPGDLGRLAAEFDPDRDRALIWHERIQAFLGNDPLPADFARLDLAGQLEALGRSFRLDPSTRPEAIPSALAGALSRDGPVRPTPLAARYPALSDYARFLGRLPRRDGGAGPP